MSPGQFLVISHHGSNLVAETIKSGGVADEEEAETFEILAWRFSTTSHGAKQEGQSGSTRAYKVQDNRHAVVSLPASKTFTS